MPSNAPQNDADVSAVDDQLATLEIPEGQAKIRSTDSSEDGDGTARPTEDSERVLDPELWKPHPPTEECPLCFVFLPLLEDESTYWVCCGKIICNGCKSETARATRVINAKRAKKKLAPLDDDACSFCRSTEDDSQSQYEERIRKSDGQAAYTLALFYRNGDARADIPKDEAKSLELLHHAADDLGYSVAMAELGRMYSFGDSGPAKDESRGRKYLEGAVKMGSVGARNNLACIEDESGNIKLAIRHWKLAAAAGDTLSTKNLWVCFHEGTLEKVELEETLRTYKKACDSMSSTERERYALLKKAEADGDDLLRRTLGKYYAGIIKAKELNLALKALRKTDS